MSLEIFVLWRSNFGFLNKGKSKWNESLCLQHLFFSTMILLKNSQKTLHLSAKTIKAQIQLLLSAAWYHDYDIGISFIGDRSVRKLNAEYRGKDSSTDILSFPFKEVKYMKRRRDAVGTKRTKKKN